MHDAVPIGKCDRFTQDDLAERIGGEAGVLDEADLRAIRALAEQFQDVVVPAGCIKGGKVRRDRLFVELYLLRRFARVPPRRLAVASGLSRSYLYCCLRRGRDLVRAAEQDGRLDRALATLKGGDDPGDRS
jgi:hypothetical protein